MLTKIGTPDPPDDSYKTYKQSYVRVMTSVASVLRRSGQFSHRKG